MARGFGAKCDRGRTWWKAADALRKYEETFRDTCGGGEGADGDGDVEEEERTDPGMVEEEERADPKLGTSRRAAEAYAVSRACAAASELVRGPVRS